MFAREEEPDNCSIVWCSWAEGQSNKTSAEIAITEDPDF